MSRSQCPTAETLHDLANGRLRASVAEVVIAHVDECESCQARIETGEDEVSGQVIDSPLDRLRDHEPFDSTETILRLLTPSAARPTKPIHRPTKVPKQIGPYRIVKLIASGGMGVVYRGRHVHLARDVAVKVLADSLSHRRQAERVLNEWQTHGQLSHANIVTAMDAGLHAGLPYLVTEYIDGMDLGSFVRKFGPFSVQQASHLMASVAKALQYAHRKGVAHLDVKPSNIMLDRDGHVRLLDMGTARATQRASLDPEDEISSQFHEVFGTLAYVAPERLSTKSTSNLDPDALKRCDFYSFGCTLHFLVTGEPPFGGSTDDKTTSQDAAHLVRAHRKQAAPRIASLLSSATETSPAIDAFQSVIDRLMEKQPADRPPSMGEVAKEMDSLSPLDIDCIDSLTDRFPATPQVDDTIRSGQTIQLIDLVPPSRGRFWIGSAAALLVCILALTYAASQGLFESTKFNSVAASTEPEIDASPSPWNYIPRVESGYFFRSPNFLQSAQEQAPQIITASLKTVAPRTSPTLCRWSPSGQRVAVVTRIGQVRVYRWEKTSLTLEWIFRNDDGFVTLIDWDPLVDELVVASSRHVAAIKLKTVPNSSRIRPVWRYLTGDIGSIRKLETMTDGVHAAACVHTDTGMRLVDLGSGQTRLVSELNDVVSWSVSPDRTRLVACTKREIQIRRLQASDDGVFELDSVEVRSLPAPTRQVRWTHDSSSVVLGSGESRRLVRADDMNQNSGRFESKGSASQRDWSWFDTNVENRWIVVEPRSRWLRFHTVEFSPSQPNNSHPESNGNPSKPDRGRLVESRDLLGRAGTFDDPIMAMHPTQTVLAIASKGSFEIRSADGQLLAQVTPIHSHVRVFPFQSYPGTLLLNADGSGWTVDVDGLAVSDPIPPLDDRRDPAVAVQAHSLLEPEGRLLQSSRNKEQIIDRDLVELGAPPGNPNRFTFSILPAPLHSRYGDAPVDEESRVDRNLWNYGRLYKPRSNQALGSRDGDSLTSLQGTREIRSIPYASLNLIDTVEQSQRLVIADPSSGYVTYASGTVRKGQLVVTGNPPNVCLSDDGQRMYAANYTSSSGYLTCVDLSTGRELWRRFAPGLSGATDVAMVDQGLLVANWSTWQIRDPDSGKIMTEFTPRDDYGFRHSSLFHNRVDGSVVSCLHRSDIEPAAMWTRDRSLQWLFFSSPNGFATTLSAPGKTLGLFRQDAPLATKFWRVLEGGSASESQPESPPSDFGVNSMFVTVGHHQDGAVTLLPYRPTLEAEEQ